MTVNDSFHSSVDALASAGDLIIDGTSAETSAAEIQEMGGTGDADIYMESDSAEDGTWAVSVLIDSKTGTWHTQRNQLLVSNSQSVRLRINNTSGATADYYASGLEVDD